MTENRCIFKQTFLAETPAKSAIQQVPRQGKSNFKNKSEK